MNLLSLFAVGFILGLTGAMAPGPLLTVTISEATKRGGLVGPTLVLGHAILELALLILIVLGLGSILHHPTIFGVISLVGGVVLVLMAVSIVRGLKGYTVAGPISGETRGLHPILSGILVSAANPYWFIWWLTVGMGYVVIAKGSGLAGIMAFFGGHISSDLAWYSFVSYGIHYGGRWLSIRMLKAILFVCSLFLLLFGIFLLYKGWEFLVS
jgi:threonine/homoserine/homoserine lactone efflux protein